MPLLALLATITNLAGVVTFEREGLDFVFIADDAGSSWRVEKADGEKPPVVMGDRIAVRGEIEPSVKRRLVASQVTKDGTGAVPPPRVATIADIFNEVLPYGETDWYGAMVTTEGLLRDINRRPSSTQLLVGEDDRNLQVEVPWTLETPLPSDWVVGATVRVTGALVYTSIENIDAGLFARVENVELLPPAPDAIEVVKRAPFWTPKRLLSLLGALLALTAVILAWAVTLRRMVARRSAELAAAIRARETERIEADAARRERLRLAADLHDGFQQYLAAAMFRLKAAMNKLPKSGLESTCAQLEAVKAALQHTQNGLRATLWAMNEESEGPESLMELFGFTARRMAHWEGIVQIRAEGEERKVARKSAASLLLIMQEAVGNALKHGAAANVRVGLAFGETALTMTVVDDGAGFDAEASRAAGHYGMAGMERRCAELGGTMHVWSKHGLGSKLTFQIPY